MDLNKLRIPPAAFRQPKQPEQPEMYKEFDAVELYCPRCKQAVPVRKRLLLVLSEGDKYEYLCGLCSESVGTKIDKQNKPESIII
jgi:hypothetical protein